MSELSVTAHRSPGASVEQLDAAHWRLQIPAGRAGSYRLAQLDDYRRLRRSEFAWQPPITLSLQARASENNLPGTWGFGLWNDPFGAGLAHGGTRLLPALPQAAWFFFASEENHLSFRDDLPEAGALAGVFCSPRLPVWPFVPLGLAAPLLLIRPVSCMARKTAAALIGECSARLAGDVTRWHDYQIEWLPNLVRFQVDRTVVMETEISPKSPLGLVIWVDNQFAAWHPDGRLNYGTLDSSHAWIEVRNLRVL